MSQFSGAPLRRLYAQLQTTFGTVVATSNVWAPATAKLVPHNSINIERKIELIRAQYKTGTGSMLNGTGGRRSGTFQGEVPMMPSGAAGSAPNADPILANIFNGTATLVASTSATYNRVDGSSNPLTLAIFDESGSGNSQFMYGGIIETYTINLGGSGVVNLGFDGKCFWVLEPDYWASEDVTGKGGLTTSPTTTEPVSPALAGNQLGAFTASVTFGGTAVAEFVSAQIKGSTGRTIRADGVGLYGTGIVQGRAEVMLSSLKIGNSSSAVIATIKNAIASKAAMNIVVVQGAVAGYIVTHNLNQVQFDGAKLTENGSSLDLDFSDAPSAATALANTNEYVLALT